MFADFDIDNKGHVLLRRISFDGFGFCETGEEVRGMDAEMSKRFLHLVDGDAVGSKEMSVILVQYFRENSDVIWKDALEEHDLLSH